MIDFDGRIDDFPLLIQTVDNLIADGTRHIVVDLHSLPFINSSALSYLISAQKNMERQGGEIVLAQVQPAITKILEMTNLDVVFPSFQSVEEAIVYHGGDEGAPAGAGSRGVLRRGWK